MFHLAAYTGNVAAVANTQVAAVSDDILFISGSNFLIPTDMLLMAAYCQGASILRANLQSPKILQMFPQQIKPVNKGAVPLLNPNYDWYGPQYIRLRGQENLSLFATGTSAGEQTTGFIWLGSQFDPLPAGEIYTAHGSSATAAVANTWTTIPYTLDQNLPAGQYVMVGSNVSSTTAIAHRWIYDSGVYRPGFLSNALETDKPMFSYLYHDLGAMGTFYAYNLPRLQVFCGAADAAHQVYIDMVKVA